MSDSVDIVLWGGPDDGLPVTIEKGVFTYFVPFRLDYAKNYRKDQQHLLYPPHPQKYVGRYQYNSMTKRFEWMGFE